MATMNAPASNEKNWYQPINDNWKSIETNLVDKSIVTAKGDLIAASGPSVPTRLGVGSNGLVLTADATQTSGIKWADYNFNDTYYMDHAVLDQRFFGAAGLLPGTQYYQTAADTAPAVDWDNTGVVSAAVGTSRRWEGVAATQLFGWDLGGLKQRALLILSGFQGCSGDRLLFMTTAKPTTGDVTGNGYAAGINSHVINSIVYKVSGGGFVNVSTEQYATYINDPYGIAMYFNNGKARLFARMGNFQWMEVAYTIDATYTTIRYCGVRMWSGGAQYIGPVSLYYDT